MIKTIFISALALLLSVEPYAVPAFTEQPSIIKLSSGSYNVTFTISEATDVEVAVIDIDDSIIVRHLAAGRLGSNAPLPLLKDSLRQTIVWDGKDDYGKPLTGSGNYSVRVRAGMKAVLDTIVGDNPYRFHRTIGGLALGENGSVYAYGSAPRQMHHATCIMALRRYSADGSYERTLWPPRAGMSLSEVSAFGVVNQPDGAFLPRTEAVDVPQLGGSPLAYEDSYLIPQIRNGALYVFQHATFRYYALSASGAFVDSGRIVKSPMLPSVNVSAGVSVGGPHYLTLSPDKKYYLLSGFYRFAKRSDGVWFPTDTGFWRDGQIFKVNAATGAAAPFISIPRDTLPSVESVRRLNTVGPTAPLELSLMAAFHGTAFDDSGRIFVCDRVRGEVGVYDTLGAKLGAIAVKSADQVAVNSKNGAVYVVCRNLTGLGVGWCRLYKYSDWRNGGGTKIQLKKELFPITPGGLAKSAAVEDERKVNPPTIGRITLLVDNSGSKPVLWVNGFGAPNYMADSGSANVRAVRDDGDTLVTVVDFQHHNRGRASGYDRVLVDRRTETVLINDSWDVAYKISDWKNPVPSRCSLSTGAPMSAADFTFGPDGYLYVKEFGYPAGPVKRYSMDRLHAPVNFGSRGTNTVTATVNQRFGAGTSDRGLAVTPDGRVYVMHTFGSDFLIQSFDTNGVMTKDSVIKPLIMSGGMRAGVDGKLYLGALIRSPLHVIPSAYSAYWPYSSATGAIVKFDPLTGGGFDLSSPSDPAQRRAVNALKIYPQPLSPFSGCMPASVPVPSSSYCCVCRSPRFDIDPYGRLYVPHSVVGTVSIADNAGNDIVSFGRYGNIDSRGFGSAVPSPEIPLAWPAATAASDDYCYVTDLINARLVKVKLNYDLNNMPGFIKKIPVESSKRGLSVLMRAFPNPFNSSAEFSISLPIRENGLSFSIYNLSGKLIKSVALPFSDKAVVTWNGMDYAGKAVPAGIYVCRLIGGRYNLSMKVLCVR